MSCELVFRVDNLADPARRIAWVALLRDIFDIDLEAYSQLGIWHPGFRAFSWMDGEVIAANVSIRPLPLLAGGRIVPAAQIHAVATRPAFRRRGLFTDLMARVLDYASARFEALLLFTATPDLYWPFGFRELAQHRFVGALGAGSTDWMTPAARPLSLASADDRALVLALHARRQPVSERFGLCGNGDVFIANALYRPDWHLDYLEREDALVVWSRAGGEMRLIDIVAPRMPTGAQLVRVLGLAPSAELHVRFPPDRLGGVFRAVPHVPEHEDYLMIRGPLAVAGQPLMLPDTALS